MQIDGVCAVAPATEQPSMVCSITHSVSMGEHEREREVCICIIYVEGGEDVHLQRWAGKRYPSSTTRSFGASKRSLVAIVSKLQHSD